MNDSGEEERMSSPVPAAATTSRPSLLFVAASIWVAVCLTVARLAAVHAPAFYGDLVQQTVLAVLLFAGFYTLAQTAVHDLRPLSSLGFVRRPASIVSSAWGWRWDGPSRSRSSCPPS